MNARILAARAASGFSAVDVTAEIESILGTIPAACRSDGGGDVTNPTVSITAPSNGATVSGVSVAVTANASDNVGVVGVQFKLNGNNLGSEDTSAPYAITWDTTVVANGSHTLTAVARDAAGNTATSSSIAVTVDNGGDVTPPTVSLTFPAPGAVISGTSTILTATANDNVGIAGVQFKIDGGNLSQEDTTFPYAFDFNSTLFADGVHSLTATARDTSGNLTTSTAVSITIVNSTFLTDPTGVSISAAAVPTFVGNPTGVSVSAGVVPPPLGNPTGASISAVATPTFLGASSSVGIVASAVPVFLGNPTNVSLVIP